MTADLHWLQLASRLEKYRLYRGALRAIERVRVFDDPKNYDLLRRIRERARNPVPPPRLYFLVTVDGLGFSLPLSAMIKIDQPASFLGEQARGALKLAHTAVARHLFEHHGHPELQPMTWKFHIDVGEFCALDGPSLGLAAALACAACACDRQFDVPVLVTGELTDNGCVHSVGGIEAKVQAALDELGPGAGHVLVPAGNGVPLNTDRRARPVATLEDAFEAVWGARRLAPAAHLLDFAVALKEIRRSYDNHENLTRLQTLDRPNLAPADRALLYHEMMIQHRHAGHTQEADRCGRRVRELIDGSRHLIDGSTIQEMELQRLGNELNKFPGPWFREALQQALGGWLDLPNRVRCLGLLARFESINGAHDRAIERRRAALELQQQRADLRRRTPGTLCHLAWEVARAGDRDELLRVAAELEAATPSSDTRQWGYNHHAMVAGSLRFGMQEAICAFLEGGEPPAPAFEPGLRDFFHADTMVTEFPQISTLRQLIRACRKAGRLDDALRLGRRFDTAQKPGAAEEDLTRWLFLICGLERDLAWCDFDGSGMDSIRGAADSLVRCHQAASIYYSEMCDACTAFDGSPEAISELERNMEGLYY